MTISLLRREDRMSEEEPDVAPPKPSKGHVGPGKTVIVIREAESKKRTSGKQQKSRLRYPSGDMDVLQMLAEMRQERTRIEEAIIALERLAQGGGKRRGRPPAWMAAASAPKRRGRPPGSTNKPKK
jgi:hypothetical protein